VKRKGDDDKEYRGRIDRWLTTNNTMEFKREFRGSNIVVDA